MSDYAKDAADAYEMILEAGGPVTLCRTVQGEYDPITGAPASSVVLVYPCVGIKVNYKSSMIDGTMIQWGDQQLYLPTRYGSRPDNWAEYFFNPNMPDPQLVDEVEINGIRFTVVSISKIEPTNIPVLYIFQIRGV